MAVNSSYGIQQPLARIKLAVSFDYTAPAEIYTWGGVIQSQATIMTLEIMAWPQAFRLLKSVIKHS